MLGMMNFQKEVVTYMVFDMWRTVQVEKKQRTTFYWRLTSLRHHRKLLRHHGNRVHLHRKPPLYRIFTEICHIIWLSLKTAASLHLRREFLPYCTIKKHCCLTTSSEKLIFHYIITEPWCLANHHYIIAEHCFITTLSQNTADQLHHHRIVLSHYIISEYC